MTIDLDISDCACFNLRKAARALAQMYDRHLQPTGLKNTQFSLLQVTSMLGPLSITDLADHLVMDRTTLSRNLKPLQRDGLLEVVPGEDARTRHVQVTGAGRALLTEALPLWESAQRKVVEGLGATHWRTLLRELQAARQAAGADA